VENMGTFTCPHCGSTTDIFADGGGSRMSRELEVPFLGSLPLDPDVVDSGDRGTPIVVGAPESVSARAYAAIADQLVAQAEGRGAAGLRPFQWNWDTGEGAPDRAEADGGAPDVPVGLRARDARTLQIAWSDG